MRAILALLILSLALTVLPAQEPAKQPVGEAPLPEGAVARLGSPRFTSPDSIVAVAISPDGKWIATAGDSITIWNAESAQVVRTLAGSEGTHDTALSRSVDGKMLASMNQRQGYRIWDVAKGEPVGPAGRRAIDGLDRLTDFRFVAGDKWLALVLNDIRVELWDVARGMLSHTIDMDREKRRS